MGNKGHKKKRNNGTNNNVNMDNKICKIFNKNRNIIWFNPSLSLISKHFKYDNPFGKIINNNNVKISYSCTDKFSKIIDTHNKKLIYKLDLNNNDNLEYACNCKIKNEYSQRNKCNLDDNVYQAKISVKENYNNDKAYIVMTSLNWKFRYYNHLQSF